MSFAIKPMAECHRATTSMDISDGPTVRRAAATLEHELDAVQEFLVHLQGSLARKTCVPPKSPKSLSPAAQAIFRRFLLLLEDPRNDQDRVRRALHDFNAAMPYVQHRRQSSPFAATPLVKSSALKKALSAVAISLKKAHEKCAEKIYGGKRLSSSASLAGNSSQSMAEYVNLLANEIDRFNAAFARAFPGSPVKELSTLDVEAILGSLSPGKTQEEGVMKARIFKGNGSTRTTGFRRCSFSVGSDDTISIFTTSQSTPKVELSMARVNVRLSGADDRIVEIITTAPLTKLKWRQNFERAKTVAFKLPSSAEALECLERLQERAACAVVNAVLRKFE
jgi:hypothetical protein